jgi:hypothetical protein
MSEALLKVGQVVSFNDPWFYPGKGTVLEVETKPHHAVRVRVDEIDPAGQHFLHKVTWLLAGSVEVVE